jgi:hypothetical protein
MRALEIRSKSGIVIADCLFYCDHDLLTCFLDCVGYLPIGSYQRTTRHHDRYGLYIDEIGDDLPVIECRAEDLEVCDRSHYHGCCGPDGDIPNIHDPSGLLIGWEIADCWTSRYDQIAIDRIQAREFDADSDGWFVSAIEYKGRKRIVDRAIARTREESELRLLEATLRSLSFWLNNDRDLQRELYDSLEILSYADAQEILGDEYKSFFQTKFRY